MEQEEELESLSYLYSEDELIIITRNPVHIQVRVQSTPESTRSPIKALLDLEWGENYPHEKPIIQIISMDISAEEKDQLCESLQLACDECMGMAMTYVLSSTLGTLLTEYHENYLSTSKSKSIPPAENIEEPDCSFPSTNPQQETKTKAQKRREQNGWERVGERPRGWNWVDVMNHLRKTANIDCIICFSERLNQGWFYILDSISLLKMSF